MDPYKVLNVERDVTEKELNRAFYYICSMYHPDKGGNQKEFLKFQKAYKKIKKELKNPTVNVPSDFIALKKKSNANDDDYIFESFVSSVPGKFDPEKFNQQFEERHHDSATFKNAERNKHKYMAEYNKIHEDAKQQQPLFGCSFFDDNAFNHAFNRYRDLYQEQTGEVEEIVETPREQGATGVIEYGDFSMQGHNTMNLHSEPSEDFKKSYRGHHNPQTHDQQFIRECQQQPNITYVQSMSKAEAQQRVQKYKNQSIY